MKITIYELLGMVKNGIAPNKIKYINSIWKYDENTKDYIHDDIWLIYSMNSIGLTEREVEIIETKENKIPEKLEICYSPDIEEEIFYEKGNKPNHYVLGDAGNKLIISKINEILDYLEVNKDE